MSPKKDSIPKGMHRMPDGSLMKGSKHKTTSVKKTKKQKEVKGSY